MFTLHSDWQYYINIIDFINWLNSYLREADVDKKP